MMMIKKHKKNQKEKEKLLKVRLLKNQPLLLKNQSKNQLLHLKNQSKNHQPNNQSKKVKKVENETYD
jgi:hypothetical protein